MSIELPEARILAEQMSKELLGKQIRSYSLQDYERLQRLGFMNKDVKVFGHLVNGKIEIVESRGSVIRVKLDNGANLILAPEYGGKVLYHTGNSTASESFHLKLEFSDNTALTVRLSGMGVIQVVRDNELEKSYVYRRDFSEVALSPADDREFTFERFSKLLSDKGTMLKSVLVGKDAVVVGLGNSSFQDIAYRAKIHPKRKASTLSEKERRALYDAIKLVIQDRIRLGGKDQFLDTYGSQGRYIPAMGPNTKQKTCRICGTPIESLSLSGGVTYFCPKCQK